MFFRFKAPRRDPLAASLATRFSGRCRTANHLSNGGFEKIRISDARSVPIRGSETGIRRREPKSDGKSRLRVKLCEAVFRASCDRDAGIRYPVIGLFNAGRLALSMDHSRAQRK
jgi:hypothetical protein